MRVFLTGFMGAGKTVTGRALARQMGWPFFDLDEMVEEQMGASIASIFETQGEGPFRRAESEALATLLARPQDRLVAALGGGALLHSRNRERLRQAAAKTVFLDAPAEELHRRISQQRHAAVRPLFAELERFRQIYAQRRPLYLLADLHLNTAGKSPAKIAVDIANWLKNEEGGGQ